jgi:integrase
MKRPANSFSEVMNAVILKIKSNPHPEDLCVWIDGKKWSKRTTTAIWSRLSIGNTPRPICMAFNHTDIEHDDRLLFLRVSATIRQIPDLGISVTTSWDKVLSTALRFCRNKTGEKDACSLTLLDAAQYCLLHKREWRPVIMLFEAVGFEHGLCLRNVLPLIAEEYVLLQKEGSYRLHYCWMSIELGLNPRCKLTCEQVAEILVKNSKLPVVTTALALGALTLGGRTNVANKLRFITLPCSLTNATVQERLRFQDEWSDALVQSVDCSGSSSAYPERYRNQTRTRVATFLLFVHSEHGDVHTYFKDQATPSRLRDTIVKFLRSQNVQNDRVKSQRMSHHSDNVLTEILSLIRRHLLMYLPLIPPTLPGLTHRAILARIDNMRQAAPPSRRRELKEEEIEALIEEGKGHPHLVLLMVVLRDVGLRTGALENLQYGTLFSIEGFPLDVCTVREKGNQRRQFMTSPRLRTVLSQYRNWLWPRLTAQQRQDPRRLYVLNPRDVSQPLPAKTPGRWLHQLAGRAGLTGVDVHPHAFRHTIIGRLIKSGNTIGKASRFLGHRTVLTTERNYWVTRNQELLAPAEDPFHEEHVTWDERYECRKLELTLLSRQIACGIEVIEILLEELVRAAQDDTTVSEVQKRICSNHPEIEEVISLLIERSNEGLELEDVSRPKKRARACV